jgi:hypothetical protein
MVLLSQARQDAQTERCCRMTSLEDYDPFKNHDPMREIHQRINQTNAEAGVSIVMPGDWSEIDAMAVTMADNAFGRISDLDSNVDAQALVRETISHYRLSVEFPTVAGETLIAYHEGTQYDSNQQRSMNRLYGLLAFDPRALVPLSSGYTWEDAARQYLSRETKCDVAVSVGCESASATEILAIKSGEFVCLYKACSACRDWFHDPHRHGFRTREFSGSDWDRR